jgi:hypothetical protein
LGSGSKVIKTEKVQCNAYIEIAMHIEKDKNTTRDSNILQLFLL